MTLPTLNTSMLRRALHDAGASKHGAARDLPAWATASLTYDVDGVLQLEVLSHRPGRNPGPIMSAIADGLSEAGWTQAPAPSSGRLPWNRPDGVGCPGVWSAWVRMGVSG